MSRESILRNIANNKPSKKSLPVPWKMDGKVHTSDIADFIAVAKSSGAEVMDFDGIDEVFAWIEQQKKHSTAVDRQKSMPDQQTTMIDLVSEKEELPLSKTWDEPDMAIIHGQFGVAENGAVWVDDKDIQLRKLPFLANHLVIVLKKENILTDMHEAYARVNLSNIGFGVFIAGPSKTADIEQALVIGAHGPVKHTVLIHGF